MSTTVADLCKQQKITLAELTTQCQLEEGRVLAIVMGRWTPSPTERERIAQVFDVPIDEITWGHKTPIQHIYGHGPG